MSLSYDSGSTALYVFARDDDYFFGLFMLARHEALGARARARDRGVESGSRYTPTTTFETFPFPWPPGKEPADDPRVIAIADAARDLVAKRDAWLNPPGASEAELKKAGAPSPTSTTRGPSGSSWRTAG